MIKKSESLLCSEHTDLFISGTATAVKLSRDFPGYFTIVPEEIISIPPTVFLTDFVITVYVEAGQLIYICNLRTIHITVHILKGKCFPAVKLEKWELLPDTHSSHHVWSENIGPSAQPRAWLL